MMTKREAWLHLAKAWDKAKPDEDGEYRIEVEGGQYSSAYGICHSIEDLLDAGEIDCPTDDEMLADINDHGPERDDDDFCWPCTKAGAKARARFCRKMARLK